MGSRPGIITKPDSEVLIFRGFFSRISSTETISPVVFLNFLNCLRKYQNLDLATIWSVAKNLILYRGVTGSDSVGIFRPITRYSFNVPLAFIFSLVEVNQAIKA